MRAFTVTDFLNGKKIWLDVFSEVEIIEVLDDIVEQLESLKNESNYLGNKKELLNALSTGGVTVYDKHSIKVQFILHVVSDLLFEKKSVFARVLIKRYLSKADADLIDPYKTNINVVRWLCKEGMRSINNEENR